MIELFGNTVVRPTISPAKPAGEPKTPEKEAVEHPVIQGETKMVDAPKNGSTPAAPAKPAVAPVAKPKVVEHVRWPGGKEPPKADPVFYSKHGPDTIEPVSPWPKVHPPLRDAYADAHAHRHGYTGSNEKHDEDADEQTEFDGVKK